MLNWQDREYVNARKKVFKNLDTDEILNLELQDDPDNISKESQTPLTAHNLNLAQQELVDDMSKTYVGTNITADTVAGYGRINKIYGKEIKDINLFDGILIGGTFNNGVPNTSSATTRIRNNSHISVESNTDYIVSAKYAKDLQVMIMLYDSSKTLITSADYYNTWKNMNFTFNTTSNTAYVMFVFRDSADANISVSDIKEVKLQKGTVATPWSPHNYATVEVISQNGENKSINRCYVKNGLNEGDCIDYISKKIIRASGTKEDIDCSDKIIQYADSTNLYNRDGAKIEVSLTNNETISRTNENLMLIEEKRKLLWENTSASMGEEEINLSSDDYDELEIQYRASALYVVGDKSETVKKGANIQLSANLYNSDSNIMMALSRFIKRNSDTSFSAELAHYTNLNAALASGTETRFCTPLRIYGIKL